MIPFSLLNDFIFCPFSIYFHNIYKSYNKLIFQDIKQVKGSNVHQNIDKKLYKKKSWIENLPLFSEKFLVYGFADLYNFEKGILLERKLIIKNNKLFFGQRMQLIAQAACLNERNLLLNEIKVFSKEDNKIYLINLPTDKDYYELNKLIDRIINFNFNSEENINPRKCLNCIYKNWCYKNAFSS